jgi:hypothetical protein
MTEHVVTARGTSVVCPYIVATEPTQREMLVDLALQDPGLSGVHARTHSTVAIYVWDRPVFQGEASPKRRMIIGFFARFGGAMFVDETTPDGEDWAWLAIQPFRLDGTPTIYFDQDGKISFPPRCVMTIEDLREVVLDWVNTGKRATVVEWLPVNTYLWTLDGAGEVVLSPDRT